MTPTTTERSRLAKILVASTAGSAIEWYDFFIYGTAAALVFNKQFFPGAGELEGTLLAFATFGAGFLARPLGGVVFGHIGDSLGRKRAYVLVLTIMGISTTAIGLLPTASSIGLAAPLLLVTLRIIQGIAVGGQFGGASLLATENAPSGRRGLYGSLAQLGVPIGLFLSSTVFLLMMNVLSTEQFETWGWRVPFLLSVALIAIGWFVHVKMDDTSASQEVTGNNSNSAKPPQSPIIAVLRRHPLNILLGAGMILCTTVGFYIFATYILSYGTNIVGVTKSTMLIGLLLSALFLMPAVVGFAALSDRVGRRTVFLGGLIGMVLWIFPAFMLINTGKLLFIALAMVVAQVFLGAMQGILPALMHELFPAHVRYSGASLGYQVGVCIGGALTPLGATALYAQTGSYVGICLLIIAVSALASFCLIYVGSRVVAEPDPVHSRDFASPITTRDS